MTSDNIASGGQPHFARAELLVRVLVHSQGVTTGIFRSVTTNEAGQLVYVSGEYSKDYPLNASDSQP